MKKASYFDTLNDALSAEGLIDIWPTNVSLEYGETVRVTAGGRLISIYRNGNGRYERPVHYAL